MANGDHDFTAGEILTAANVDDYLMLQSIEKFATSAARDAALTTRKREGMVTYQDDANSLTNYSGAAWSTIGPVNGALTAWTPTVTQLGSVTVTVNYAVYSRIGRLIIAWFRLTVTGSGTGANAVTIGGLPGTTMASSAYTVGGGEIFDTSASAKYEANLYLGSSTAIDFRGASLALDNRLGIATFTAGLAVGDTLVGNFTAESSTDA